jgi:hypothetical protein
LYGDLGGNRTVNNLDRGKLKVAYGSVAGGSNDLLVLDVNPDGTRNNLDRGKFNLNFGTVFSDFTPTI